MKKLVFFDVDGTLLPEGDGNVPESTIKAIKRLQEQDIGAILCTGRHPLELKQLDLLKYNFDGFVLLNRSINSFLSSPSIVLELITFISLSSTN